MAWNDRVAGLLGPSGRLDFAPALAAQRSYVQQTSNCARFGLVVPETFVRGIRDLGYRSNGDAIAELIDNALQACAHRIDVLFGYEGTHSAKKPSQIAVIDNGHGMVPEMIRMAMMWGGTHRENDRGGLGRYGYGLPCSSVSLGRRFTVFSQVAGGCLYAATLDLDELAAGTYKDHRGDVVVPEPQLATLPSFVSDHIHSVHRDGWISGTAVLVEKLDRLEWSTTRGLRDNLCRQFGVAYHKLCRDSALFVQSAFVEPCDPLFLTPGARLHDIDDDRAHCLDPVRIEVRHPENGAYLGLITLRYSWLPPSFGSIDKSRDAVGMNANARFDIMKNFHGIIFSRNGRLIDVQTRTPWTTFINNDRYIKVEVEFSATLDEWFGVTTSKQQVTVSPFAWDLLRGAGLPRAIEQLRNKATLARLERKKKNPASEEGIQSPERAVTTTTQLAVCLPRQHDFGFRAAPYRLEFRYVPASPFFTVDREAGVRILKLNTAHVFYQRIYNGPTSSTQLRSAIELLLLCIGEIALDLSESELAQHSVRLQDWSRKLADAVSTLAFRVDSPYEHHS